MVKCCVIGRNWERACTLILEHAALLMIVAGMLTEESLLTTVINQYED